MVAKVEWHPGELHPPRQPRSASRLKRHQPVPFRRAGDMVLRWPGHGGAVYQGRQERDQLDAAVMSEVPRQCQLLQLHALAYNLANFMPTLALPKEVEHWSLTTLRA